MGRNHRSRLQIVADILSVVGEGAKKTWIIYKANLNHKILSKYLAEVLDADLLSFNTGFYRLTRKGQDFLNRYKEYKEHFKAHRLLEEGLLNNEKTVLKETVKANPDSRPNRRGD